MHDIMRKRLWRKLDALPDQELYRVLDFIEFLESKYSRESAEEPSAFQRTAERLEDRLRARRLPPRVIGGTMTTLGTAGRLLDSVTGAGREALRVGRDLLGDEPAERASAPEASMQPDQQSSAPRSESTAGPTTESAETSAAASTEESQQRTVIPIE